MVDQSPPQEVIAKTFINSFNYLYQDARLFHERAKSGELRESFERVQLSRTAILLYVLSLEGLINRAWEQFLPEHVRRFFLEREQKFSLEDKWWLLPALAPGDSGAMFDRSCYPWSHFVELIRLRNDFVHPKHDRAAYYRFQTRTKFEPLDWEKIPKELEIKETAVAYRGSHIPRDPYSLLPEHVDTAKKIVDAMVDELDRLLDGQIKKDNWHLGDKLTAVFPPGATFADLPDDRPPRAP